MGDIHDECLSKWVAAARDPQKCEICKVGKIDRLSILKKMAEIIDFEKDEIIDLKKLDYRLARYHFRTSRVSSQ